MSFAFTSLGENVRPNTMSYFHPPPRQTSLSVLRKPKEVMQCTIQRTFREDIRTDNAKFQPDLYSCSFEFVVLERTSNGKKREKKQDR